MIRDRWYAVLESREVPSGRPVGFTRLGERLVFWRDPGRGIACLRDVCAHRGAALSLGRTCGDRVACPFHGFEYDPTGRGRLVPANGRSAEVDARFRVASRPARDAHGLVWVWSGEPREDLPPVPWFDDLDGSFSVARLRSHWPVHYTRAIENQLDAIHLPFVHHNTIGRGARTIADGPLVEWPDPDRMRIWVSSRKDDGTPPRKPEELRPAAGDFHLDFAFPNVWQNWLSPRMRISVAFAPVDLGNTMLYLGFHQKFVRIPPLSWMLNAVFMAFNRVVLNQDRRVVLTQEPRRTWHGMPEQLVQADGPIVQFRRRRMELGASAGDPPADDPGPR